MSRTENTFAPLWASPPGNTIKARLKVLDLGIGDFAEKMGVSLLVANGIIDGQESITIDIGRKLSRVLGASPEFWITRDCQYHEDLVRVDIDRWLTDLPVGEMTKLGWIDTATDWQSRAQECFSFFGVPTLDAWRDIYEPTLAGSRMRISPSAPSKQPAIAAWLHKATSEAEKAQVESWNISRIEEIVPALRKLTRQRNPQISIPKIRENLASAGVALVVLRSISGCPASGAAKFLSPERAMIVVSGRYLADDQFWFTVFHEIGHLVLHCPTQAIVDAPYSSDETHSQDEQEANRFAVEALLPADIRLQISSTPLTPRRVIEVADTAGVSPGIIVGQLQFQGTIGRDRMNNLKRRYKWSGANLEMA